jgi:hypothetical protein
MAKNLDFFVHLEQTFFGGRQTVLPFQKIAGKGLQMASTDASARHKWLG